METENEFDFSAIEKKWQDKWAKEKVFEAKDKSTKPKFYCLEMYPYPSASGLHMGHAFQYTLGDILARYKRMKGFNVLYPMGYDSFGLPAENAAIKAKSHPKIFTDNAIKHFIEQQKSLGLSYDWTRTLSSHDENYYKWNQFFFQKFYEKGLVYRKKAPVNWCPECNTVLANEQVHDGKCWRHSNTEVEIRHLEQWFIKTTDYAQQLLEGIETLQWPERIKSMQKNWIGKSFGTEIMFEINGEDWPIFTTRADTIHGVTFMVVSAQHPRLNELVTTKQKKEVDAFLKKIKSTSEKDSEDLEKEGAFTGSYAINPLTKDRVPIYTGNFVVADYGSGMVMAVPAHDQRDFEFAKKYKIPIKVVIKPKMFDLNPKKMSRAFTEDGTLVNSGDFNGYPNREAIQDIQILLEKVNKGKSVVQYKLRDWLVSRQRYWGTPIPMIYCDKCGIVPVPQKDLPVKLPQKVEFGKGNPLSTNKEFLEVKCPKCKSNARRETDTMDTFFDSSWYFLRYCDNMNNSVPFDKKKINYWMPVDFYTGGAEHATMHLIYSRFFVKALRDLGYIELDEPFTRLYNQGMLHGEDGTVMSKSKPEYNIDPLTVIKTHSADALRIFLFSSASPDKDSNWSTTGMDSNLKFVSKVANYINNCKFGSSSPKVQHSLHSSIQVITSALEEVKYNIAIIKLKMLFDSLENEISKEDFSIFVKLLAPFCPHLAEELWNKIGQKGFVSLAPWPECDKSKINEEFDQIEKAVDKTVSDILNIIRLVKEKQSHDVKKIYLYTMPNELKYYDAKDISKRTNTEVKVFAVNDKNKHDPQGKASKAKPEKPAIYAE